MIVDFSELEKLAADLGAVPARSGRNIRAAVSITARRVKDDWRENAKGMPHAPAFPYSITYDIWGGEAIRGSTITAEIGPDKGRAQGALGNLIEFGSRNNPPQGLGHGALLRNESDFQTGLERAVADAMKASGL